MQFIAGIGGFPPKNAEMPTATHTRLEPKGPPGRKSAKARAFQSEIARLYVEGYTCEAIRDALADVGVSVSVSTVRRELARRAAGPQTVGFHAQNTAALSSVSAGLPALAGDSRNGKEVAESFFKGRITNPLLRDRSAP